MNRLFFRRLLHGNLFETLPTLANSGDAFDPGFAAFPYLNWVYVVASLARVRATFSFVCLCSDLRENVFLDEIPPGAFASTSLTKLYANHYSWTGLCMVA
jgi:hypothetical protein